MDPQPNNLHALLARSTATKVAPKVEPVEAIPAPAETQVSAETIAAANEPGSFAKFLTPGKPVINKPAAKAAAPVAEEPKPELDEKTLRASAEVTVASIDITQEAIFTPLQDWKFRSDAEKKFGDKETVAKALTLSHSKVAPIDEDQLKLKNLMDYYWGEHVEKKEGIPFTKKEISNLEEVWYKYYKIKQTEVSPEVLLICAMVSTIGKRATNILL